MLVNLTSKQQFDYHMNQPDKTRGLIVVSPHLQLENLTHNVQLPNSVICLSTNFST